MGQSSLLLGTKSKALELLNFLYDRELSWQTYLLISASMIVIVPLLTWLNSSLFLARSVKPGIGREPPIAPYCIPYIQHLYAFLDDPQSLYDSLKKRYGNKPVSLIMMNIKFHVFSDISTALNVFQRPRDFSFEPVLGSLMENALNLPACDRKWFHPPPKESKTTKVTDINDPRVFVEWNINIWKKYLNGKWLDMLVEVFLKNLLENLEKVLKISSLKNGEWIDFELHEALGQVVFQTTSHTFFGTRLLELWGPTMWEDFKTFNTASYIGSRTDLIYKLAPGPRRARERMLKTFEAWCAAEIDEGVGGEWDQEDSVWNDKWGARLNLEKEELARKLGFSIRGRAAVHSSFLYASNLNAIPLATWTILAVISSPERRERFRQEAATCLLSPEASNNKDYHVRFDLDKLQKNPYINAVWQEATRLGGAMGLARAVTRDTELQGYMLKAGSVILLPVRLLHFDEDVFTEPQEFKPERWLIPEGLSESETEEHQGRIRKQKASLRAFGGGVSMCAGRWAAEKEILTTVAALLTLFDFEVENGGAIAYKKQGDVEEGFQVHLNPRSMGIMDPAGAARVRMRKRAVG